MHPVAWLCLFRKALATKSCQLLERGACDFAFMVHHHFPGIGHQHRTSYQAQNAYTGQGPTYPTQGASSSSAQAGGSDPSVIGATVDRGDGEAAHVFALKDARRNETRRRELEDGLNDSATNLSELPPAYASLRPRTDMG